MAEKIRVEIEGDPRDLERACARAVVAIDSTGGAARRNQKLWQDAGGRWRNEMGQFASAAEKAAAGIEHVDRRTAGFNVTLRGLDRTINQLNARFTFSRNAMGALKWPVYAAGAGQLAGALAQVAAGLGAVAAAGAPAAGVLAAIPQGATLAAQAIGVLGLATNGLGDALTEQTEAAVGAGAAAQDSAVAQEAAAQQVEEAQRALTEARREARVELSQLATEIEHARNAEKGAEITLREALKARRELLRTPGASRLDLDAADQAVADARLAAKDARRDRADTEREAEQARRRGVDGAAAVVQAEQRLADAKRGVAQAARDEAVAIGKTQEAMDKLPASAQAFVRTLLGYRAELRKLRTSAADGLLPGLGDALESSMGNFDVVDDLVARTAKTFGAAAREIGEFVGSDAFGRDLERIGRRNVAVLEDGGKASLNWAQAATDLMIAAGPLVDWLSDVALEASEVAEEWARNKRESGDAFDGTIEALEQLWRIAENTAGAVGNIADAGRETGGELLDQLGAVTGRWERWTGSVEGQNELEEYFEQAKPTIEEAAGLLADLVGVFFRLGDDANVDDLLRQIRADVVPALEEVLDSFGDALGPELVDTVASLLGLFAELAEEGGGLAIAVDLVGDIADGLAWIIDQVPLAAEAFAGLALWKMLGIGAALKGVDSLLTKLRTARGLSAAPVPAGGGKGGKGSPAVVGLNPLLAVPAAGAMFYGAADQDADETGRSIKNLESNVELLEEVRRRLDRLKEVGAEKAFDRLNRSFQRLNDELENGFLDFGDKSRRELEQLAATAEETGRRVERAFTRRWSDQIADNWEAWSRSGATSVESIRHVTERNTEIIKDRLDTDSEAGRRALARNFREAADAVQASMDKSGDHTKEGARLIRQYLVEGLKSLGLTDGQARAKIDNGTLQPTSARKPGQAMDPKFASGGLVQFGTAGAVGPDSIPARFGGTDIVVAPGEVGAVINRHQMPILNQRLADYGGLHGFFSSVNARHDEAFARGGLPGFAGGGIVEMLHPFNDPAGHGGDNSHLHIAMSSVDAIIALGKKLQRLGWLVSEHPAFGGIDAVHDPDGYHYTSQAIDVNWPNAAEEAAKIRALLPMLGDPSKLPGGKVDAPNLKQLISTLEGGPGALANQALSIQGAVSQDILDRVAKQLNTAHATVASGGGTPDPGSGAASRAQMVKWATEALQRTGHPATEGNIEKILTLARKESGWIVDSINNWDSNAAAGNPSGGLMHVTIDKVGGSRDRLFDPVENMVASIIYQFARYGGLITHSPYARGGIVAGDAVARAAADAKPKTRKQRKGKGDPKAAGRLGGQAGFRMALPKGGPGVPDGLIGRFEQLGVDIETSGLREGLADGKLDILNAEFLVDHDNNSRTDDVVNHDGMTVDGKFVPGIAQFSELQQQVVNEIGTQLATERDRLTLAKRIEARLQETIREGRERLQAIAERIKANAKRITALRGESTTLAKERSRKDTGKDRKKAIDQRRRQIDDELDGLYDEQRRLTGDEIPNPDRLGQVRGGLYGRTRNEVDAAQEARPEWVDQLRTLPFTIQRLEQIDLPRELGELFDAIGTKVPVSDGGSIDDVLDGLLEQKLVETQRGKALSDSQYEALLGMAPLVQGRLVGSFDHGGYIPETGLALVHAGEYVTPAPVGPYNSQLGPSRDSGRPVDIKVELVQTSQGLRARATVDGTPHDVSVEQGRRARLFAAAPGSR